MMAGEAAEVGAAEEAEEEAAVEVEVEVEVEVANNLLQRPQLIRAPVYPFERKYSDRGFAVSGWPRLS
jgi:hypothetical protein